MSGAVLPLPQYVFMACAQLGGAQGQLYLLHVTSLIYRLLCVNGLKSRRDRKSGGREIIFSVRRFWVEGKVVSGADISSWMRNSNRRSPALVEWWLEYRNTLRKPCPIVACPPHIVHGLPSRSEDQILAVVKALAVLFVERTGLSYDRSQSLSVLAI
jgi:hypothetical protein